MAIVDRRGGAVEAGETETGTQTVSAATGTVGDFVSVVYVTVATCTLTLPRSTVRLGRQLRVVHLLQSAQAGAITLTPVEADTIMQEASWVLTSNAASRASVTLWPDAEIPGWYIAP